MITKGSLIPAGSKIVGPPGDLTTMSDGWDHGSPTLVAVTVLLATTGGHGVSIAIGTLASVGAAAVVVAIAARVATITNWTEGMVEGPKTAGSDENNSCCVWVLGRLQIGRLTGENIPRMDGGSYNC